MSVSIGGVPFIEQVSSNCSLATSDSAGSSISSPSTTDSGLETGSKATSREDLSDLEQCSSSVTTPCTATSFPGTESGSSDAQVRIINPLFLHCRHYSWLSIFYWWYCVHPMVRISMLFSVDERCDMSLLFFVCHAVWGQAGWTSSVSLCGVHSWSSGGQRLCYWAVRHHFCSWHGLRQPSRSAVHTVHTKRW